MEHWEIPTRTEEDGSYILSDITDSMNRYLEEKQISKLDVEGVGIGVPGPVGPDGTVFKCVNLGWGVFNVEQRLTALTGLKAHPDTASALKDMERYTSKEIFDKAKKGDAAALEIVEEAGRLLGKGTASIACVVNPEAFVIGGGMAKAGEMLLNVIRKYYRQYAFHASRETEFRFAELGNSAGIYGGVRMVLE